LDLPLEEVVDKDQENDDNDENNEE